MAKLMLLGVIFSEVYQMDRTCPKRKLIVFFTFLIAGIKYLMRSTLGKEGVIATCSLRVQFTMVGKAMVAGV